MRHSTLVDSSSKEAQASTQEVPRSGETSLWACALAEAIGTFGLVFAGCGAIMIDTESHGQITHVGVGLCFWPWYLHPLGRAKGDHLRDPVKIWAVQKGDH